MKRSTFQRNLIWLRICITTFLLAIASLFLFSFTVSSRLMDDVWSQLGLTQLKGNEKIKNSFVNNYLDYYGVKNAKNIATGNRAAVAKSLLVYTKQYVNSPAFKTDYEKMRNQAKPMEPVPGSKTKDLIRKWKIEETTKLMKNTENFLKTTTDAEMKKTMEKVLEIHKTNMKDYQDPNSKMINALWQQELDSRENDVKRYKESLKIWELNYPADHRTIIRSRLEKYLELAATVDFSAEIFQKADKKYYFKIAYERKHDDWKMIYRAGKEVYDVTKVFAEQWIKESGQ